MDSKELARNIGELILSKKGYDIKILELKNLTTIADYFVLCTADSTTQVKAIADNIEKQLRDNGIKCYHKEGYDSLNWVLLDYVDLVVHIFKTDSRSYYNLEKFWGDAPIEIISDSEEEAN